VKISFPYKHFETIEPAEVPDANLLGVFEPRALGEGKDSQTVLKKAFANPIGAPKLRDLAKSSDRVLILIDDYTRGTPVPKILPHVLEELESAGVKDRQISILTAQGTHREMTDSEIMEKLGPDFGRFPVHQHHWLDASAMHRFGTLSDGTPVSANKLLAEHDLVLGIVSVVPHRIKGFSGGAKIAFPGVSGPEMQSKTQWEGARRMSETVMGVPDNPMRHQMEEAARLVGLRYVVNIVSDSKKNLTGCFVGDPVASHREASRLSREVFGVPLPSRADIVLVDSHPADYDFWQSAKGYYSGTMAVKKGGTLILVAPNPEGVAKNHPNVLEIGYRPYDELRLMVESGQVNDVVGASILADNCQIIESHDCIMVSPGVTIEEKRRLNIRHAQTVQDAVEMALEKQGKHAKIAVLRQGGHILPLVEGESKAAT
jgi:nickel-dependent lactate racemase